MITDVQTNTVYFSNLVPEDFPKQFIELARIIESAGYRVKLLAETYDYYCRDYMPVQVAEKDFVQFIFRPKAYFEKDQYAEITNPVLTGLVNNLETPRFSPLILDGGNVIKAKHKAIVSDRIIKDNLHQLSSEHKILEQLEKDLKCQVIIIPEYPHELTGHADGLIRFIDDDTVFINETYAEPEKEWLHKFLGVLTENNLLHIILPCPMTGKQITANGLYINYLHVENLIVVPQFKMKEDKNALQTFKEIFGNNNSVVPFDARWIAEHGGVLNCVSWTIRE
jgi:agmatine deiminase